MSISSIFGFISLAGWVLLVVGAGLAITNMGQRRPAGGNWALAVLGLVVGVVFFLMSSGLVQVGATEVAVIFQSIGGDPARNGLWERPLGPGVHVVLPIINEPIIYSTQVQNYTMSKVPAEGQVARDDAVQARTRDGQQVDIDISVLYQIDRDQANNLHLKWQNRYQDGFVRPTVRSAVREAVAAYSVNDLYGGTGGGAAVPSLLPRMQDELNENLRAVFAENGLRLQELLIREITFSEEFIRAVESRQVAQQQAEQAQQEAIRVRTIAEGAADAEVLKAEGDAKASEARAKGDSAAIELRAAAEAKALELINAQISKNPQLIQWRYIEQLADNISMILLPSNSPFLFDFNQLSTGTPTGAVNGIPAPSGLATPPPAGTGGN